MKHLKYLRYILLHKWYVFIGCCKLGIPLQGLIHDISKFRPSEWFPYAESFYGDKTRYTVKQKRAVKGNMKLAWLIHYHRNPHHWKYWCFIDGANKLIAADMPLRYRKEMLADWRSVGMTLYGYDNTKEWYEKRKDKMILHENTRLWLEANM